MVRTLNEVLAALPPEERAAVDRRCEQLINEVEATGELRRISEMSRAKIAELLNISQPAVSKIEKQTDMYLSTLRSSVEAMGGDSNVIVHLPNRPPVKLQSLEDINSWAIDTTESEVRTTMPLHVSSFVGRD
jgi:hypothetical protein